MTGAGLVTLFLCGDVMTGRGVDQILPHPGDPQLAELYVHDAGTYVDLAERVNGPVPRPVGFAWPWGDALLSLDEVAPDLRLINLETSITRDGEFAPGKAVHYRMAPENLPCLAVARPDACVLANNHVLDFGQPGLADTLDTLAGAAIPAVGAGRTAADASEPARLAAGDQHVIVAACGDESSGVPTAWAAGPDRGGVNRLPDLSVATADRLADRLRQAKQPGDLTALSIHWGSNWGYEVPAAHVRFAHRLIERGVDLVHGHSSHHPRPIEVHRGKLILYGCGDFIDDYEGISGYERYRDDLRVLYFASLDPDTGRLAELRMAVMQARQLRLHHASPEDRDQLGGVLDRISRRFGSRVTPARAGMLSYHPA